jgi:hypothetical protein
MKNEITLVRLVKQWPDLKKRADNETDPQRLIAVLREIDEFLLRLEITVATIDKERLSLMWILH